jgi:enamine deaminase RidA (YjgF/YER057c/UK114 family)
LRARSAGTPSSGSRARISPSQFEQALENVLAVLREAGGAPGDICRMTAYCTDKPAYLVARRELGRIWRRLMGTHYPAMTLVFVADLLDAPGEAYLRNFPEVHSRVS